MDKKVQLLIKTFNEKDKKGLLTLLAKKYINNIATFYSLHYKQVAEADILDIL